MAFETFDKRSASSSKQPMITITRGGPFSINRAAQEAMGAPEYVELLYDRTEKLIGFRPSSEDNPRAFPVRAQGKNAATFVVAGQAFAKHYDLDTSVARRYSVQWDKNQRILVLNLKSDSVDVTGPRAAMKSRLGAQ